MGLLEFREQLNFCLTWLDSRGFLPADDEANRPFHLPCVSPAPVTDWFAGTEVDELAQSPSQATATNLIFFEKTGRTKEVWFYEVWPPEGRKKYTKTRPMRFEEFAECQAWWGGRDRNGREENEHAWRIPIATIQADNFSLDRKNPNRPDDLSHRPPEELIADLLAAEEEIRSLLEQMTRELSEGL